MLLKPFDPDTLEHVEPEVTHVLIVWNLWVKSRRLAGQAERLRDLINDITDAMRAELEQIQ